MNPDFHTLIHGYLDDSLSGDEQELLSQLIKSNPLHARQFASELMLHDRLRNELMSREELTVHEELADQDQNEHGMVSPAATLARRLARWSVTWATTACLVLLITFFVWRSVGTPSASAAVVELNRIIAANTQSLDRSFLISVEETVVPRGDRERNSREHGRPPKPSLDGAILDLRGQHQFVLTRKVAPGEFFITGSDGTTSWAVRPDGPVRFSHDMTRFNRDFPGHEQSLPINNLHDGLDALKTSYDLEVMPVESNEAIDEADVEPNRLMVAVKKRRFLGAARIEISYAETSGQIRQVRFVRMPYGPEQVTLTMTLIEERTLPANHFAHPSHHAPERDVEIE